MLRITRALAALAVTAGLAAGCSDGTASSGSTRLTLQITDAPTALFASAEVDIGRIVLIPADGAPITVTDNAGTFNLLDLQNGVTSELASLDIPAGNYLQLRLVVTGARVTLADGLTFRDGSTSADLKVPSGAQSGIKINLFDDSWTMGSDLERSTGVNLTPGETIIVLDFDVSRNFLLTGPRTAPTGVIFKPLIRAVVQDIAGSISGVVTNAATSQALAGATVRATLVESPEMDALQTAEATAITGEDGSYTIWFLVPGTYTVDVDGVTVDAQTVTVGRKQAVTGVDFSVTVP